jgi:hypothetical protein
LALGLDDHRAVENLEVGPAYEPALGVVDVVLLDEGDDGADQKPPHECLELRRRRLVVGAPLLQQPPKVPHAPPARFGFPLQHPPEGAEGSEALADRLVQDLVGPDFVEDVDEIPDGPEGIRDRNPELRRGECRVDLRAVHPELQFGAVLLECGDLEGTRTESVEPPQGGRRPVGSHRAGSAPQAERHQVLFPAPARPWDAENSREDLLKCPRSKLPLDGPQRKAQFTHLIPRNEAMLTGGHRKPALHNASLQL